MCFVHSGNGGPVQRVAIGEAAAAAAAFSGAAAGNWSVGTLDVAGSGTQDVVAAPGGAQTSPTTAAPRGCSCSASSAARATGSPPSPARTLAGRRDPDGLHAALQRDQEHRHHRSVAGDLKINETVGIPNWLVSMTLPCGIFA
jgi:acetamidase/formamidase